MEEFVTCTVNQIENYKNQKITLAGVVTKFIERFTKSGKPFGLFSVEDYEGSIDLAIFGEDYLKNRHMLMIDNFVYLTGKVEERYNQPGVWEFRTWNIQLLNDIRDSLSKEILLRVLLEDVSENLVSDLTEITQSNPGKCLLKLNVFDQDEKIALDFMSKQYKVNPSNQFFQSLKRHPEVRYEIIKSA